jgi:NadR type nicotinamide-nucleotide adenylyltransferase
MRKVVIVGPESTGKSTLSAQLAEHYKTIYCPEFAREYLADTSGKYTQDDLLTIAMGQIELEDKLLRDAKNNLYFIDTDMYVMKVWSEVVFASCHKWILQQIATRSYDLHLLCNVDLPWVPDELREYPELHLRKQHFKMYEDALINSGEKWAVISGSFSERLQTAIHLVDTVLLGKSG